MRWATLAVVFFSLVCSAFSTDSGEEPSLKIMASPSVYNTGEKKGIYCEVNNTRERIDWLLPSGEVVQGRSKKNTRVYVERKNKEENMVALIIHSTKIEDSGNWTCKSGDLNETITIVVGEKVMMTPAFEEIQEDESKNVKLKCIAKGIPKPLVQWYKEGLPIPDEPKYKVTEKEDEYILEIRRLTHADAGEYMCKVTQKALSYYTHKNINLTVHHKPIPFNPETRKIYVIANNVKFRTEEIFAVVNETKKIVCSVLASPPPRFKWFRRKNAYDEPIHDSIEVSEDKLSSTLSLYIYGESDQGQYKCTAQNDKGSVSTIYDVTLGEKPIPPDYGSLKDANATYLVFNVTCNNCTIVTDETEPLDPSNLPVTGYEFEVAPHVEDFPVDWENGTNIAVNIEDPDNTLFELGPLPNTTTFHVRVRSVNAAGFSDWLELPELYSTTSDVTRLTATLFLLVAAYLATLCY